MDIGFPLPPRLNLVALRDFVAGAYAGTAVETKVGLFVGCCGAVGVIGDFAVAVSEIGVGGSGEAR